MAKVFYHIADLDGHCSGAIVQHFTGAKPVPFNYGYSFPEVDELTYMVDCSLPIEDMIKLASMTELIWIDHHKTIINDARLANFNPNGLRLVGQAACELCWQYFTKDPIPYSVKLIGRYDVWDHSDPNTLPFHYGMKMYDTRPGKFAWDFNLDVNKIIENGKLIQKYQEEEDAKILRSAGFEKEKWGYKVCFLNRPKANSFCFEGSEADIFCAYFRNKSGTWTVSLYSTKVDVSEIARSYGGGGHTGAAGFTVKEIENVL